MSDRGVDRDRRVRDLLASEDWFAVCSRGSHGAADVVAIRAGSIPRVVQVKSTAQGPYERFGPAKRRELSYAAELGGAQASSRGGLPEGSSAGSPSTNGR